MSTDLSYPSAQFGKYLRTKSSIAVSPSESHAWGTTTIPRGQQWVGRKAKAMWNQIVAALVAKNGVVSLSQKFILHSIVRAEIHCQLAERLRRDRWNTGDLSLEQFDSMSRNIVKISAMRDRMILELGIDANELDVFSSALNDDLPTVDDPSQMLDAEGRMIEESVAEDGVEEYASDDMDNG